MTSVDDNPVTYEGRSFVRSRRPYNSWVSWNNRLGGGPLLVVRKLDFEVAAPRGMKLESRELIISSNAATMWLDKIGWAGTPFDRRECIHVTGRDQGGRRVEVALSPREGLQGAWQALLNSGVSPRDPA